MDPTHTVSTVAATKLITRSRRNLLWEEWQLLKCTWLRNKIENKQPVDNEPQLHSESTGGIKADLVLKVYALLMRDVLPSRANNSANDQDSVQEFLRWSEQISVEFVTKKPCFPSWRLIRLHHRFLCDVSLEKFEKVTARRRTVWTIKSI